MDADNNDDGDYYCGTGMKKPCVMQSAVVTITIGVWQLEAGKIKVLEKSSVTNSSFKVIL